MKVFEIKQLVVDFISLVDNPANKKKIIYKNANEFEKTFEIKKVNDEQRIIYGLVYTPDELDTQAMFTNAEVIKNASYDFIRSGKVNNVDTMHDKNPNGCYVCESWLTKEADPIFPDEPSNSWAVAIKIDNEAIWESIKKNELRGLSLYGYAELEEVEKADNEKSIFDKIVKLFNKSEYAEKIEKLNAEIEVLKAGLESTKEEYEKIKEAITKESKEANKELAERVELIESVIIKQIGNKKFQIK